MLHIHHTQGGSLSASRPRVVAPGQAADGKPDCNGILGGAEERNRSLRETRRSLNLEAEKFKRVQILNLRSLIHAECEC